MRNFQEAVKRCLASLLLTLAMQKPGRFVQGVIAIDGDAVLIDGRPCRLLGIDTLYLSSKNRSLAKQHLAELTAEKSLICHIQDHDVFGRPRILLFDETGTLINRAMVEDGYAKALWGSFRRHEKSARRNERGIWQLEKASS